VVRPTVCVLVRPQQHETRQRKGKVVMSSLCSCDHNLDSNAGSVREALLFDSQTNGHPSVRVSLGLLLALAVFLGVSGCSSSNHSAIITSQTPNILVAFQQSPPTFMNVGTTSQISAVVTNDVANAGVDWVATCNGLDCGTFNPSHTGPGQNTSYTAPAGVPSTGKVSVNALSATDHSKAIAANVVIVSNVTGVTLTAYPPASLPAGALLNLGADIAGDPANLGVDWTATCTTVNGPVTCSPAHLHSPAGGTVQRVVPQTVSIPGTTQPQSLIGTVITVTARATADHNFFAISTFTVTDPI